MKIAKEIVARWADNDSMLACSQLIAEADNGTVDILVYILISFYRRTTLGKLKKHSASIRTLVILALDPPPIFIMISTWIGLYKVSPFITSYTRSEAEMIYWLEFDFALPERKKWTRIYSHHIPMKNKKGRGRAAQAQTKKADVSYIPTKLSLSQSAKDLRFGDKFKKEVCDKFFSFSRHH